jgi:hypothetical protein
MHYDAKGHGGPWRFVFLIIFTCVELSKSHAGNLKIVRAGFARIKPPTGNVSQHARVAI